MLETHPRMTEQGLWAERKTDIEVGCLGSSFDIVFLGHLLNGRMEVKIHETCLLWNGASASPVRSNSVRPSLDISCNQGHHVAELLGHHEQCVLQGCHSHCTS